MGNGLGGVCMQRDTMGHGNEPQFADSNNLFDVHYLRTQISNVVFLGDVGARDGDWILVDAGMPNSAPAILDMAKELFDSRPAYILLTHGHFDHVGALIPLVHHYDVPVYAHPRELPYLTGQRDYPAPDPMVGGGLMSFISPMYPRHGLDLGDTVLSLPERGPLPLFSDWTIVETPGHTEGHISLFRSRDGALIAGDAITTVKQESVYAVITQRETLHGPPAYFTTDWNAAKQSVQRLQALQPKWVVTGHGRPMQGVVLRDGMERLAYDFDKIARPVHGRYVH